MNNIDATALKSLVEMSHWVGDPGRDLVILAEGNTSIKVGADLIVKASGAALHAANDDDFVQVRREPIAEMIRAGTATDEEITEVLRDATTQGSKRPSVETLLHVVCQEHDGVSAVIHSHPTPVNALLCSTKAEQLVRGSYFPDQIVTLGHNPLLIPYIDPGLDLAHVALRMLRDHALATGALPKVIYLQNHGMFALGADPGEAKRITLMAVKTARIVIGALSVGDAVALSASQTDRIHTRPDELLRRHTLAKTQ